MTAKRQKATSTALALLACLLIAGDSEGSHIAKSGTGDVARAPRTAAIAGCAFAWRGSCGHPSPGRLRSADPPHPKPTERTRRRARRHCGSSRSSLIAAAAVEASDPFASTPRSALESLAADLSGSDKYRNVVVVMGAGASVSAGIPDFRTPGTGL